MKINKKQTSIDNLRTLTTLLLVFAITASAFAILPFVNAHDPAWQVPTFAYLTASPNPIGVNQQAVLIFWLDKPPPSAAGAEGDRWLNLKVEVTKPDGTSQVVGTYTSDSVGGSYALYTPDQVGTYTFKFSFPGQVASQTGPTGLIGPDSPYIGDNYLPSSTTATLTVQNEPIPESVAYPLPTSYWSRPIEAENTVWASIASNWLGSPQIVGKFQPDGIAPNSPHIMWTKPFEFGGVVGGSQTSVPGVNYYTGLSYEGKFTNPLILYGRLYYDLPQSNNPTGNGYVCVDLQTGEEIYYKGMLQPTFGQLYDYESPNQHGVIPNGYLWASDEDPWAAWYGLPTLPTTYSAYDPIDGNWLFNLTNVPSGTKVYGPNGEILLYELNYANRWLALWNNTAAIDELGGSSGSEFWQWRPIGKNIDASGAYSWNVTIPDLPGSAEPSIIKVIPGDMIIGQSSSFAFMSPDFGTPDPYTFWAINLNPERGTVGSLLWLKDYPAPTGNTTMRVAVVSEEARMLAINERETMQYWGISIDTGEVAWGPTQPESALDFYQKNGANEVMTAYGRLYTSSYGGVARCYDLKTGELMWSYNDTAAGLSAVWPNYPLGMGAIADDKVYLFTSEHSPNAPLYDGARVRCLNATTGEELWTMLSWASGFQAAGAAFAVADGYLIYLNTYDMQVYCIGKGASATTVTASTTEISLGSKVLIQGTVTDIAAGTQQTEQAARFPNGVPAVSDESQSAWMEYVYMQKPKPTDVTGVPVHLTVIDPNGNSQDLGTAVSDDLGNYVLSWTPQVPGIHKITATFEGSESYYSSQAGTAFVVSEATAAAPIVVPTQPSTSTTPAAITPTPTQAVSLLPSEAPQPSTNASAQTATYIAIGAAVIVIVAVAAVLVLRQRK
jgi:outer membrane protein assembly factor BamB